MLNEMEMKQRGCTQEMEQNSVSTKKKPWPVNCPWPEPLAYSYDYDEEMVWSA